MILTDLFKVKVAFKLTTKRSGINLIEFYSPYKEWQTDIRDAFGNIFQRDLYFSNYGFGPSNKLFTEIFVKAPIDDISEFLTQEHGFTRTHQDDDRIISHMLVNAPYVYVKKMNKAEFSKLVHSLNELNFTPEVASMMEHLVSFSDF